MYNVFLFYETDLVNCLPCVVAAETEQITLESKVGVSELKLAHFNLILVQLQMLEEL